jgi:hypothetical protein
MSLRILTRKPKKRKMKNDEKIKIPCSYNGEKHEKVILDKELVDSLYNYKEVNSAFAYLMCRGFLNEEVKTNLTSIITDCRKVFIKYNLSKCDVQANYNFNKSKVV